MSRHVHFVGSIGLDSTDDVFAAVGKTVKAFLKRCPDGEIGGRRLWISYQWPLLRATSFLEPASDHAMGPNGAHDTAAESAQRAKCNWFRRIRLRPQTAHLLSGLPERAHAVTSLTRGFRFVCQRRRRSSAFVVPPDITKVLPAYTQACCGR